MSDRAALHKAVCEHPDEDTPRLVFADWLDEHGTEADRLRARFIRVQCEMARTEEQSPRWRQLYAEQNKLQNALNRSHALWPTHLEGRVAGSTGYERGFLAFVTVYAKRFLAEAAKFYADDPIQTVRFVSLIARRGSVPTAVLFDSPHLANLRTLDLTGCGIGDAALGEMADSPHLARLRQLVLSENPLGAGGLARLIDSPRLAGLAHLDLSDNAALTDDAVAAMASRPGFRRVRGLDLSRTGVTVDGVRRLAESPHAAGLERLRLARPLPGVGGAVPLPLDADRIGEVVAGSPHLANLREVDLFFWPVGLNGLRALGHSPHLKSLRRLLLGECQLPPKAARLAADAPNFRGLYQLHLGIPRRSLTKPAVPEADEKYLREAIPDAAVRFEG